MRKVKDMSLFTITRTRGCYSVLVFALGTSLAACGGAAASKGAASPGQTTTAAAPGPT
jgi:hypothetical protein